MSVRFPYSWEAPEAPGYGTFPGPYDYDEPSDSWYQGVSTAVWYGFRHIDTAHTYYTEKHVGKAIRESGVQRDDIFLTSKLDPDLNCRNGALDGVNKSMLDLGTYLDLFLVHYPGVGYPAGAWEGLCQAKLDEFCKHIGVSNFEIKHLEVLLQSTDEYPEVNQIEFHPLLYSDELMELVRYCREKRIQVEGYCPFAANRYGLLETENITTIAQNHGRSPAQVTLKWCMQHGVRPIVGSLNPTHIADNAGPYDFELTPTEMRRINALGLAQIRVAKDWLWDPANAEMNPTVR